MKDGLSELLTILSVIVSAFLFAGQAKSNFLLIFIFNAIVYILLKRQERIDKHETI